jgi:serine/threonine protein kinase
MNMFLKLGAPNTGCCQRFLGIFVPWEDSPTRQRGPVPDPEESINSAIGHLPSGADRVKLAAPIPLSVDTLVNNRYRILALLARGGVSVAYKAHDTQLNQPVALKFLLPDRLTNTKDVQRFEREAGTLGKLHHPAIASLLEVGTFEGEPYLVMDFLDGQTLAQLIEKNGQLELEDTIDLFVQICEALEYAHSQDVLHRDIKPSNIMVTHPNCENQHASLLDFGIAKLMESPNAKGQSITGTGEILGSPYYMSPEQARAAKLDARSDLYSLGCTLYESLTGSPPHIGSTAIATLVKHGTDRPLALSEASLGKSFPQALEAILSKLLENDPCDRYQSAQQVKDDLLDVKSGRIPRLIETSQRRTQCVKTSPKRRWEAPLYVSVLTIAVLIIMTVPHTVQHPPTAPEASAPPTEAPIVGPVLPGLRRAAGEDLLEYGRTLTARGEITQAEDTLEHAISELKRAGGKTGPLAEAYLALGDVYLVDGKYKECQYMFEQRVQLDEKLPLSQNSTLSETLNRLAYSYLVQDKPGHPADMKKIFSMFQRAHEIAEKVYGHDSVGVAGCIQTQGDYLYVHGLFAEAERRFQKAIAIYRRHESVLLGQGLVSLALVYEHENKTKAAESLYQSSIDYTYAHPDCSAPLLLNVLGTLITHYTNSGKSVDVRKYRQAQHLCEHVLPFFEKNPGFDKIYLGILLHKLGHVHYAIGGLGYPGEFAQAEVILVQARQIFTTSGGLGVAQLALLIPTLADIYRQEGKLDQAKELEMEMLNRKQKDHPEGDVAMVGNLGRLAAIALQRGDNATALSYYEDACKIIKHIPSLEKSKEFAVATNVASVAYVQQGDLAKGRSLCLQAREIFANTVGPKSGQVHMMDTLLKGIDQRAITQCHSIKQR